jgi:hypothetical protein
MQPKMLEKEKNDLKSALSVKPKIEFRNSSSKKIESELLLFSSQ